MQLHQHSAIEQTKVPFLTIQNNQMVLLIIVVHNKPHQPLCFSCSIFLLFHILMILLMPITYTVSVLIYYGFQSTPSISATTNPRKQKLVKGSCERR